MELVGMCFSTLFHTMRTEQKYEQRGNYEISLSFHFTSHLISEEKFGYRRVYESNNSYL